MAEIRRIHREIYVTDGEFILLLRPSQPDFQRI